MLNRFRRKKQPLLLSNPPQSLSLQAQPLPPPTKSLFELLNLNPLEEEEKSLFMVDDSLSVDDLFEGRSKYDDRAVIEQVRRCPNDAKRKYRFAAYLDCELYPLIMAVILGGSLEAVGALYEANPDAITQKDIYGNTVLHQACEYKVALGVTTYLVEKYPSALEMKDRWGYTPLHVACLYGAPLEVVGMLLERYLPALHMKDEDGDTPLMCAKKYSASPEVIQLLEKDEEKSKAATASSSSVRAPPVKPVAGASSTTKTRNRQENLMKSSSSPPIMFAPPTDLVHKEGKFVGALAAAREGKRWLLVNLQQASDFSSRALDRDVWRNEIVQNLIKNGFVFWQTTDDSPEGRTYARRYDVNAYPHVAIIDPRTGNLKWRNEGWTQANPMTAETFAAAAVDFCSCHPNKQPSTAAHEKPATGMEPDEADKRKPAAKHAQESQESHDNSLFELLNLHPVNHRSLYKNEPVLEAIRRDPQAARGKYIFPACNKSRSHTPLAMSVALGASLRVVESLYNAWQEAIQETDFFGRTPLHFGCLYHSSSDVIIFLADKYHPAIELEDSLGQTPLHVACTYGAPMNVVELLVDRYPAAINIKTKSGETPFMLATKGKTSPEVLELLQKANTKSDDPSTEADTKEPPPKKDEDSDMHAGISDSVPDDGDDNEEWREDTRTRARTGAWANEVGLGTDTTGQSIPPSNIAPSEFPMEVISVLTDMGFDREKVLECLRKTNGDAEAAVDLLLNSSTKATYSSSAESIQPGSAVTTEIGISGKEVQGDGAIAATAAHRTSEDILSPAAGDVDIPTLTPSEWATLKALTANPREFDSCFQSTGMTLTPHDKEIIRLLSVNLKDIHRVLESVRGLPATLVDKPDHVKSYFQIFTLGFERTYVAALALASGAVQGQLMSSNRRMLASVLETLGSISSGSNIPFLGFVAIFMSMGTHILQQHESNMLHVFQEFFHGQSRDEYLLTYRAAAEQICLHPDYLSSYGGASCDASGLRTKIVHAIERVQNRLQRCHLQAIELLKPIELKAMDDLSTVTDSVLKLWSERRNEYDELKQRNEKDKADFALKALGIDGAASCEVASLGEQGCEERRCETCFTQHGPSSRLYEEMKSGNNVKAEAPTHQLDILRHLEEQTRQNQELREEQKRQNQQLQRLEKENREKSARMKFLEKQVAGLGDEDVDVDGCGSGLQQQCRQSRQSKANKRTVGSRSEENTEEHANEVTKQFHELRQELSNVTDALERTRLGVFFANRLLTVLEANLLVTNILLRSSDDIQGRAPSSLIKTHSSIVVDEKGCFTLNGNYCQIGKFRSRSSSWKGDLRIRIDQDHNGTKSVKSWFEENGLGFRFELHSKAVILEMFAKELAVACLPQPYPLPHPAPTPVPLPSIARK